MYKNFFEYYMRTEPPDIEHKYIFIVSRPELAQNILFAGYQAVCIHERDELSYKLQEFLDYMQGIALTGTNQTAYTYVIATEYKKTNDDLEDFMKSEYLTYRIGWKLFKDKEHLEKTDCMDELKSTLRNFIFSYETPPEFSDELNEFHDMDENGKATRVIDLNIAEYLLKVAPFFVIDEIPFVYEDGMYYQDVKGIRLKAKIQKLIYRDKVTQPTINRVYQLLIAQQSVQKDFDDLYNYPEYWVNFKNGFYDPIEKKMIDHSPKYLSVNQIPFEFYPDEFEKVKENCASIRAYLDFSIPDPMEEKMMWEYLGYSMTSDTQFQKFMMLLGDGGTGKSVVIDMFQNIVGKKNSCHISLQDLNKRFYATNLFGKLMNSCGDIPCKAMETTDVVKKATGEDMLMYERKNKDPLFFHSHAKLLFSANDMPENLEEKSDAFYRRLLVLDINRKIPKEKKDTQLKKKISGELDYAIHMAMQALSELYERKEFTESDHSKECVQIIQRASDSVKAFIDEKLVKKDDSKIERSAIYLLYEKYCEDADRKPLGKKKFFGVMERKGFTLRKTNGIFYFLGVAEKEEEFMEIDDSVELPFD